jgi:THO complex subunit 2
MRRLRDGNVMELGILRTLLKVPGGYSFADYSPAASLSSSQLEGLAGSITLKRETISFGIVEEVNHRAADIMRNALHADGFGVSMLILISQVRSRILFNSAQDSPKDVKLVGNLYDSCQVVMSILLEFLTGYEEGEEEGNDGKICTSILKYAAYLPTLAELQTKFGFDIASMWMLCRPLIRAAAQVGDDDEVCDELQPFCLSESFRNSYKSRLPDSMWSFISPDLFEFFYSHNLQDIFCPINAYKSEISRVKKEVERMQLRHKNAIPNSLDVGQGSQKNEAEEIGRLKSVSQTLDSDLSHQERHVVSTINRMQGRKSGFFLSEAAPRDAARTFLVQCTFPRSTQSPGDAMYCAQFVSQLHTMETPGFSTLHYIDELISVISGSLFGVTEGEAANLAILLWETWKIVNKWRYDEDVFNKEVLSRPGSVMSGADKGKHESVTHKDFISLYNTWHASLGAALVGCLESSEYMHTRAGLVLLTRIVEVFPTRPKLGNKLLRVLAPFQDENSSRLDIRASANAYGTMLLKARDEGTWVEEDASVAKARAEKERAAAEERKRKIAEQFQEMKRDSEKITEEIGNREGQGARQDRRREPRDHGSSRGATETDRPRSLQENGKPGKDESHSKIESGEISGRGREQDRRGGTLSRTSSPSRRRPSPPRDLDRGRERDRAPTDDRIHGRNDTMGSPSGTGRQSDRHHGADSWRRDGGANDSNRGSNDEGLGGRWKRGEPAPPDGRARTGKRTRPPSPDQGNDGRGERTKRARLGETRREEGASPPRSRPRRRGRR